MGHLRGGIACTAGPEFAEKELLAVSAQWRSRWQRMQVCISDVYDRLEWGHRDSSVTTAVTRHRPVPVSNSSARYVISPPERSAYNCPIF